MLQEGKTKTILKFKHYDIQRIYERNGNEVKTTFWEDFSIAERFGLSAIQDTFNQAPKSGKEDYEFLTELIVGA